MWNIKGRMGKRTKRKRVDESSRGVRADCGRTIAESRGEGGERGWQRGPSGGWGERKFTEAICC